MAPRNGYTERPGGLPLPRRSTRPRKPSSPEPAAALPLEGLSPISPPPTPQRQFRQLQEAIRLEAWEYAESIGYNPWHGLMELAFEQDTSPQLQFECHREVAQYFLPKLKPIEIAGELEHHHTSEPLQVLFAQWEHEEEAERATLPPWEPPGLEALEMRKSDDEVWDLDDEEEADE